MRALTPVLLLLVAAIAVACGGGDTSGALGRNLEVYVSPPELVDEVSYADGAGSYRVIRASASNRQLAVVNVTVVNRSSIITPLLIDADTARIGSRRSDRINAIDPFEGARPADTADVEVACAAFEWGTEAENCGLFLWGNTELERRFQVEGYMVFDVPKGLSLKTFWWSEVEEISVELAS